MENTQERFDRFIQLFNTVENREKYDFLFERFENGMPSGAFGIIRHEIRNCLVYGMFQAALTLTNHYMEKFLKVALINSEVTVMMTDFQLFNEQRAAAIQKFGKKVLFENINSACEKEIITENEKTALLEFKNLYRNTFSHFDHQSLIADSDVQLYQFSFTKPGEISQGSIDAKNLFVDMGHTDADFAKKNAVLYFMAIDDIAMRYELKQSPGMVKILLDHGFDAIKIFNQIKFTGGQ
ncbi:hypothetical protein OQX63_04060 [Pedobacter sp. PF22-3]|uniref:hypothetical protein n=1 Tax=Pedobacter sp. PF22-3 TaxID=2994467 RepID=UPI0022472E26|nr:hypothetical protein [Pedobacter sp. PF22-3]MCX2492632.1 hypothetical protein [Pedobacter sp. PF22-3]